MIFCAERSSTFRPRRRSLNLLIYLSARWATFFSLWRLHFHEIFPRGIIIPSGSRAREKNCRTSSVKIEWWDGLRSWLELFRGNWLELTVTRNFNSRFIDCESLHKPNSKNNNPSILTPNLPIEIFFFNRNNHKSNSNFKFQFPREWISPPTLVIRPLNLPHLVEFTQQRVRHPQALINFIALNHVITVHSRYVRHHARTMRTLTLGTREIYAIRAPPRRETKLWFISGGGRSGDASRDSCRTESATFEKKLREKCPLWAVSRTATSPLVTRWKCHDKARFRGFPRLLFFFVFLPLLHILAPRRMRID